MMRVTHTADGRPDMAYQGTVNVGGRDLAFVDGSATTANLPEAAVQALGDAGFLVEGGPAPDAVTVTAATPESAAATPKK